MAGGTGKGYMAKIGLDTTGVEKGVRSLERELKAVDNALKSNQDSVVLNNQRMEIMGEEITALQNKLRTLKDAQDKAREAFANGQMNADEYRAYQREIEQTENRINDLTQSMNGVQQGADNAVVGMDQFKGALDGTFKLIGEGLEKVTELTAAFLKESIQVGKQFESSMSQVAATMGINKLSEDYAILEEKAKEMGATTRYTASEAADALNYLALAGYNATTAVEALPQVLSLAQAGGMDLARASDMITDTMSALHLTSEDTQVTLNNMTEMIDKMARTAQRSNTSVAQLGDAMLTVGGTAANMSGGLTEINTMLGILADNGIKASEGGTHLRNILLKMSKPTKNMKALMSELNLEFYDAQGALRPLPDIFLEMKQKMDDMEMSQQQRDSLINKAFNPTDIAAVNALLGTTSERFEELKNEIDNAKGAASGMAETMNENLDGALMTLNSAKEAIQVELYKKINEPLAEIVNNVSTALKDISSEISDSGFGEEFTIALNKISDAVRDALPKIIDLFKQFSDEIVPRLGDVAVKIVDITADEVLPRMLDLFEWLIDHSAEVEAGLRLIITAMATGKVMDFTNGLIGTVTQLSKLGPAATNVAAGLTSAGAAGEAAAGGAAAASAAMGPLILILEAVTAAALVAAQALDAAGDAKLRNAKYLNGFTDESNATWDEYRKTAAGEYDDRTLEQADEAVSQTKKEIDETQQEIFALNDKIRELNGRKRSLERQKEASGILWGFGDTAQAKKDLDAVNAELESAQKHVEELRVGLEADNNLLHEQEESRERIKKEDNRHKRNQRYNDENARRQAEAAERNTAGMSPQELAKKRAKDEEEAQQIEAEEFAARLEYQEELWDKQYHWDKKNQDEYWREREKFLDENRADTEEWWTAWNETEKKLGKMSDKTGKEIDQNLTDAEKQIKDKLTSFKNSLNLDIANGKDEYEANEELGRWLNENLDHSTELYKTEYAAYLNKQSSLNKKAEDEQKKIDKEHNDNVKKQLDQKFTELENTAKTEGEKEGWTEEKLLDEKQKVLDKLADKDSEIYAEYNQKIINARADLAKKRREETEAQAEKDKQAEEKAQNEILDAAQKAADKLVSAYESRYSNIMGAVDKPKRITDANGKERLIFTDYNKKLQELRAYQKNLEKLKGLGLSSRHLQEIFSMDFDTRAKYISELLNLSSGNREKYLRDYEAYSRQAEKTAKYELDFDTKLTEDINKVFEDVDGYENGKRNAAEWLKGFEDGLKGTPLEGYEITNIVDPKTTSDAQTYNRVMESMKAVDAGLSKLATIMESYTKKNTDSLEGIMSKAVADMTTKVTDQIKAIPIVINIDNKKTVETVLSEQQKRQRNSGAR